MTRPVLLPGEAFDGGDDLPAEALRWESWNDVGAAAYHFAEVFSERRIRLDPATRDHLNSTIGSIRRCLTERLYPLLSDLDGSIGEQNRLVGGRSCRLAGGRYQGCADDARARVRAGKNHSRPRIVVYSTASEVTIKCGCCRIKIRYHA